MLAVLDAHHAADGLDDGLGDDGHQDKGHGVGGGVADHGSLGVRFAGDGSQSRSGGHAAADTAQDAGAAKSAAEQVLQQIRADNDLIADPEISRKIDRIETLTGKIFDYLEKHPERAGELQTFMDYYLPQTLKTLETYARLEAEGIETDSIRQAKAKISGILDKLCDGYEKQLDKLFQTDAMDITADIAVMEQMLKKDGLTEDEFAFEIKGK